MDKVFKKRLVVALAGCPATVSALFLISIFLFGLADCDVVKSHYATRKDAEADQLFERGWLPAIIPDSSRHIVISNDLDLNLSKGGFAFDPGEYPKFASRLKPYSGLQTGWNTSLKDDVADYEAKGFSVFEYAEDDAIWIFYVHPTKGCAEYFMWLERR